MEDSSNDSANVIPELKFEVVYARTIESPKKHVVSIFKTCFIVKIYIDYVYIYDT